MTISKTSLNVQQISIYLFIFLVSTVFALVYGLMDTVNINQSMFAFDRSAIYGGEYYRLITGHFLHTNFYHYFMNVIGLTLLYMLHGEYVRPARFLCLIALLCLSTSLCILWLSDNISWYVGLSGILHGIFAWGVVIDLKLRRKSGYLLLAGLIIKLIQEQFFSSSTFLSELIQANVAVDAHLYGAILGFIMGLISISIFKNPK